PTFSRSHIHTLSLHDALPIFLEAQRRGELVGWSMPGESFFYPPDVAQGGVDLDALVVVRVPDVPAVPRAGEKLLRSGAFGLVVLNRKSTRLNSSHVSISYAVF